MNLESSLFPYPSKGKRYSVLMSAMRGWAWLAILACLVSIYLLGNFGLSRAFPASLNIYLVQPFLWCILALFVFLLWRFTSEKPLQRRKSMLIMAALIGGSQVALMVIAGIIFGFGRSPYSHRPLAVMGNLAYVASMLVGIEMSRAYLLAAFRKHKPALALAFLSLFFTLISIPAARYEMFGRASTAFRISGETLLPAFSENLLASFLAIIGGPLPSIIYRGALQSFEWMAPILPNLRWTVTAFLGTVYPALGMLFIRHEFLPREPIGSAQSSNPRAGGSSSLWLVVAATAVAFLWLNTGLFGVRPTLVSGVSMKPALEAGDVAIIREISPEEVNVGDIIRYRVGEIYLLHRVVDIQLDGDRIQFITRGDANNVDDLPVSPSMLEGKLAFSVPKIGWVAIETRRLIQWIGGLW